MSTAFHIDEEIDKLIDKFTEELRIRIKKVIIRSEKLVLKQYIASQRETVRASKADKDTSKGKDTPRNTPRNTPRKDTSKGKDTLRKDTSKGKVVLKVQSRASPRTSPRTSPKTSPKAFPRREQDYNYTDYDSD